MRKLWNKWMNSDGFTLIELLAVVAILAILAGVGIPRVLSSINTAKEKTAIANVQLVASAAERYVLEQSISGGTLATASDGADFRTELTTALVTTYLDQMPAGISVEYNTGTPNTLIISAENTSETRTVVWEK